MSHGNVCEKCRGGKEFWCVIQNCEGNIFKSFGYTLRNYTARIRRFYLDNVSLYYVKTEFQRSYLIGEDFPPERIVVIPNMVDGANVATRYNHGDYIG